jgi:hypothetical protein
MPQEVITVSERMKWNFSGVLPFAYRRSSIVQSLSSFYHYKLVHISITRIIGQWNKLRLGRVGFVSRYSNVVLLDMNSQCKSCRDFHQPQGSGTSTDAVNSIPFMIYAGHPR